MAKVKVKVKVLKVKVKVKGRGAGRLGADYRRRSFGRPPAISPAPPCSSTSPA